MVIHSPVFLIFLAVVFILYWSVPRHFRWIIILVSSFLFYASFVPAWSLVLILSILFNYALGISIEKQSGDRQRSRLLVAGIILNVSLLAVFKYFDSISNYLPDTVNLFFSNSRLPVFDTSSSLVKLIVPAGISFFTLSAISYLIEIKRKKITAERHPGYFACNISFFPKLIMGPIERPNHFLPQIREGNSFRYDQAVSGLKLMLWGYFKKLVVADRLAPVVDTVYASPQSYPGPTLAMATILYAFQLYFDFSAYTDIARGAGKILGFEILPNFNRPYASVSIREFWTRWHMTLSSWLRDYIFLPFAYALSGKLNKISYYGIKTEKIVYTLSIFFTFFICGLWHGVGWNFIIWGLVFALYLSVARLLKRKRRGEERNSPQRTSGWFITTIQILTTFLMVCFTWVFFRTGTPADALQFLSGMLNGWRLFSNPSGTLVDFFTFPGISTALEALFVCGLLISSMTFEYIWSCRGKNFFDSMPFYIRWSGYAFILFLILTFGNFGQQFIYSRF
ncbi:MAG: MBOAT family O-acyltransferase [Bacteroidota bacterium]